MTSTCKAKEPLTCRFHGQELMVDYVFDYNKRTLGWNRSEFTGAGEETVRQIVFHIATIDNPREDVPALLKTVHARDDLNNLRPYFAIDEVVQEIAYLYDPHKHEVADKNLLDEDNTDIGVSRVYAKYLAENGSPATVDRYIARHHCKTLAAVHSVDAYGDVESTWSANLILSGKVTCSCGRHQNIEYRAHVGVDSLMAYALRQQQQPAAES